METTTPHVCWIAVDHQASLILFSQFHRVWRPSRKARRCRRSPQSGSPGHVSSPRLIKRSMRISRTTLSCLLRVKGYVADPVGSAFPSGRRTPDPVVVTGSSLHNSRAIAFRPAFSAFASTPAADRSPVAIAPSCRQAPATATRSAPVGTSDRAPVGPSATATSVPRRIDVSGRIISRHRTGIRPVAAPIGPLASQQTICHQHLSARFRATAHHTLREVHGNRRRLSLRPGLGPA